MDVSIQQFLKDAEQQCLRVLCQSTFLVEKVRARGGDIKNEGCGYLLPSRSVNFLLTRIARTSREDDPVPARNSWPKFKCEERMKLLEMLGRRSVGPKEDA